MTSGTANGAGSSSAQRGAGVAAQVVIQGLASAACALPHAMAVQSTPAHSRLAAVRPQVAVDLDMSVSPFVLIRRASGWSECLLRHVPPLGRRHAAGTLATGAMGRNIRVRRAGPGGAALD